MKDMKAVYKIYDAGFFPTLLSVCKKYGAIPVFEWSRVNPERCMVGLSFKSEASATGESKKLFERLVENFKKCDDGTYLFSNGEGVCLCEAFGELTKETSSLFEWAASEKVGISFSHQDLLDVFGEENEGHFYRMKYM